MTYAILLGLGAALGLWQVSRSVPEIEIPRWVDLGLWVMAAMLVGARLLHTAFLWEYYLQHPAEIHQFWLGGLSWPGALLGGLAAVGLSSLLTKIPLGLLSDRLSALALPLVVAAWLGSWQAGAAYGIEAPGAWWSVPARSETGLVTQRFPLQPLAAFVLLAVFAWLQPRLDRMPKDGQKAAAVLFLICFHLLLASFLRADPAPLWYSLRPDTWAALAGCVIGGLALIISAVRAGSLEKIR